MIQVLIATYNGAQFVDAQIRSVLSELCDQEAEVLISDDWSSDETVALVKRYSRDRVRLLQPPSRRGSAKSNFSYLLGEAVAQYLFLADQDDVWLPGKVNASLECLRQLEAKYGAETPLLVIHDSIVVDDQLNLIAPSFWRYSRLDPEFCNSYKRIVVQNVGQGCTMAFNRALLEKSRPVPSEAIMHDWWLMLVATVFGKVVHLANPFTLYRQHGANHVGAKSGSPLNLLSTPLSLRAMKKSISETQDQANALVNRYRHQLNDDELQFFENYAELKAKNGWIRKSFCFRNHLAKAGYLKTLGFYILV